MTGMISVWRYQGVVRKAVVKLKYKFVTDLAEELIQAFVNRLKTQDLSFDKAILIPVPLHRSRQRWRGFNQAELLGRIIAEKMDWGLASDLVVRTRQTKPQVELKGADRRTNVVDTFAVTNKPIKRHLTYVIFDDVATTGSTIKEVTKVLRSAGARKIWGLTIAS